MPCVGPSSESLLAEEFREAGVNLTQHEERCPFSALTRLLCTACKQLEDALEKAHGAHLEHVDGESKDRSDLVSWWEHHQEQDAKREEEESARLKRSALAKLTPEEAKVIGVLDMKRNG